MSKMTREDMLRELELLPVWQLRQALPQLAESGVMPASPLVTETTMVLDVATDLVPVTTETSAPLMRLSSPLRALVSEDNVYMFLMQPASALPDEATELLLQNMLRAMRVIARTDILDNIEHIFTQHPPKLIICLGAESANLLLDRSLDMQDWRSQQESSFRQTPVIVTFSPQHLLQHTQDKALAWQDLCLAMQRVQDL